MTKDEALAWLDSQIEQMHAWDRNIPAVKAMIAALRAVLTRCDIWVDDDWTAGWQYATDEIQEAVLKGLGGE